MASKRRPVSETIEALSFPRQAHPNFYLNAERIRDRFHSYLGSIREFSESIDHSGEASAEVQAVILRAGVRSDHGGSAQLAYDLDGSLAQALVLRAYLATAGELHTDAREAPATGFVLARGPGGLIRPSQVADSPQWQAADVPRETVGEIEQEQQRQAATAASADPKPLYWVAYANTGPRLVVSLLGDASMITTDVRSWLGVDMTYGIFGQKIRDWGSWTLLQSLHVWVEPPGQPAAG